MPLYIRLLHEALATELNAILPIVIVLLAIGVLTATFQAAFQLEDTALSLLPKTIAMIVIALMGGFGALRTIQLLAGSWITHTGMLIHQSWS